MKEPLDWEIGDLCFCGESLVTDGVERRNEHHIPGVIQGIKEGKAHVKILNGMLSTENLSDIWECPEEAFDAYVFQHRDELEKVEETRRRQWSSAFAAVHEFNGLLKGIRLAK